ncbi:hypothetical protein [Brucella grignonensis]|uniref:Uncharacterized protein n=1 Tax=Brucella grignonensis TaxID=94627 RepID=A0A256FRJ7_9HYPH|nr:hypothetical protein [Brucella grignonensis]OYR17051.1 hypothetical protein CEV33_4177 [Brucella grignonensis]
MKIIKITFAISVEIASFTNADDLVFIPSNGKNSVLAHFYTSNVGVNDWEGDVFGQEILNPGETIADGRRVCKCDMRFEFRDSDDLDTMTDTQDLCKLSTYTIEERA